MYEILFLFFWTNDSIRLDAIKQLSQNSNYADASLLLNTVRVSRVNVNDYFFYKTLCAFSINNKSEALRSARHFDVWDTYDIPWRYIVLVDLMKQEMEQWKDDDLGDVSRDMGRSSDRLKNSQGGAITQKIQEDILTKLDKLIKENEDTKAAAAAAKAAQEQKRAAGSPNAPLPDSAMPNNSGPGKVNEVQLRQIAEGWGKLPDKQRADAMAKYVRSFPPRYRDVIETYFKKMADVERK
jgi:hypothetical protein